MPPQEASLWRGGAHAYVENRARNNAAADLARMVDFGAVDDAHHPAVFALAAGGVVAIDARARNSSSRTAGRGAERPQVE